MKVARREDIMRAMAVPAALLGSGGNITDGGIGIPSSVIAESVIREERRRANSETDIVKKLRPPPTSTSTPRNSTSSIVSVVSLPSAAADDEWKASENRVKVIVRVRPPISEDLNNPLLGPYEECVSTAKTRVRLCRPTYDEREFSFDSVLPPRADQSSMYHVVAKGIVEDVLKGYNGTVIAYGQTGTGKTYTIFGPSAEWESSAALLPSSGPSSSSSDSVELASGELLPLPSPSGSPQSASADDGFPQMVRNRAFARGRPLRPRHSASKGRKGTTPEDGVIPRAVAQIFEHIEQHSKDTQFVVTMSFLQIYMENIMDLLDVSKTNLSIREDPKNGIFVESLTQVVVHSLEDVLSLVADGARNRAMTCTNMNKISSRSHVILILTVEQKAINFEEGEESDHLKKEGGEGVEGEDEEEKETKKKKKGAKEEEEEEEGEAADGLVKRGVLTIVDLAGSERVAKSLSEGQRLEEAKRINKSLSALGNCVAALTSTSMSYVPFRDSKLTRLLTDSLGGNSKTSLCATIGPASFHYEETHSTLLFATRAMAVKNHAVVNEVVDFKAMTGTLQRQIVLIETEKARLLRRNAVLEREVLRLKSELEASRSGRGGSYDSLCGAAEGATPTASSSAASSSASSSSAAAAGEGVSPPLMFPSTMSAASLAAAAARGRSASIAGETSTSPTSSTASASSAVRLPTLTDDQVRMWEKRERELVTKFTNIIQHLQLEIAKQTYVQTQQAQAASDGDAIVEQLVSSIVRIPALRLKILEKLKIDPAHISKYS